MNNNSLNINKLFDGFNWHKNVKITWENSLIKSINKIDEKEKKNKKFSEILIPGFIDIQVNGGGGVLFNDNPSIKILKTIINTHSKFGTTSILPTLITDDIKIMQKAADSVALAIKNNENGIIGIHFEGPHLSKSKKGVHSEKYIRPLSNKELEVYSRNDLGIKLITVAPENITSEQIKQLINLNCIVSLGHSNANSITTLNAIKSGASCFTHLYNAMSQLNSREPGMVGVALNDLNSYCGLILDGVHVNDISVLIALRIKPEKIILITDSMSFVGSNKIESNLLGNKVKKDINKLIDKNGNLAGTLLTMIDAFNYAHNNLNLSFEQCVKMTSLYPSELLKQNKIGNLKIGSFANMILLNKSKNSNKVYEIKNTWINGKQLY